jgi:type VI protein secretion system component VasK
MLKRAAIFGGAAFLSGVFLAASGATKLGIPEETWPYVWPALVAVVLLILAVVAVVVGWRRGSLPLWLAFLAQTVGSVVFLFDRMESPWETLVWTGATVGIVLAIAGVAWVVVYLRSRWLERRMVEGFGDVEGVDPENLREIRKNMTEALALLRRAGHGRNAVYELPWFMVIGRPAVGKTEAIKRSGLGLPVRKDWVKGVGGTHTSDFFFTNDLIFVDTPGKWVQDGATDELRSYWQTVTKMLRKFRGRRPLDGLMIAVAADDLMTMSKRELADQAANIREVVDLLHEELHFRFPVYILVTKADLVDGFADFFWGIPAQRRNEILGWSNPDPNEIEISRLVDRGLDRIQKRLESYRLEMLTKSGRRTRNRQLFFFTEEMREIRGPLGIFADELLHEEPSSQTPIFRGFYFTSAMQGEGAPVSKAMTELAQSLNLAAPAAGTPSADSEGSRSFFLLELLRDLMVGDEGLVARTRFHWLKQRRKTAFGTFLPAGLAILLVLLSGVSLLWNKAIYGDVESTVPGIAARIDAEVNNPLTYESLQSRLEATEEIRILHRKLTSFNPLRSFGMRRSEELARDVWDVYRRELSRAVVSPTLESAQRLIGGEAQFCSDRVALLHSVVWLRASSRFEGSENLQALVVNTWDTESIDQQEELSATFRRQFGYLKLHAPPGAGESMLAGFDLERAATDLRDQCGGLGQENSLTLFATFQKECLGEVYTWELLDSCQQTLDRIFTWSDDQGNLYSQRLLELKDDLGKTDERGAGVAGSILADLDVTGETTSACVEKFNTGVLPKIREYVPGEGVVGECRQARRAGTASPIGFTDQWFDGNGATREELENQMLVFNADSACSDALRTDVGVQELEYQAIELFGYQYLRAACKRDPSQDRGAVATGTAQPRATRPAPAPAPRKVTRKVRTASSEIFSSTCNPSERLTAAGWNYRKGRWTGDWTDAESAQRLTETQRKQLREGVTQGIDAYAKGFRSGWLDCLADIRWHDDTRTVDRAAWLARIADSPEFAATLRRPVEEADGILGAAADEPFSRVATSIASTREEFRPLLVDGVAAYTDLVRKVATDLAACEDSTEAFLRYQRAVQSKDPGNSLVQLDNWVQGNAGRAGGRLRTLFETPLRLAQDFVGGANVAEAMWSQIVDRWTTGLAGRYPMVADPSAELVDPEALVALFGGETGLVNTLPEGLDLDAASTAWLDRARQVSEALFDGDNPRPMTFMFHSPDAAALLDEIPPKFKLTAVVVAVAAGQEFVWAVEEGPADAKFDIDLFGLGSDEASVEGMIAERKGLKRFIGKDWKDGVPVPVVEVKGPWAPVRLLSDHMPPGSLSGQDRIPVAFEIPWEWDKGKKQGRYGATFEVRGDHLATLVGLVREGFPSPPAIGE